MVEKENTKQPVEPGDCILFATADWDEPYWTNKQHCAKELTRLGWRVLYVESVGLRAPKAGSKKDLKRLWLRLQKGLQGLFFGAAKRDENLWVLSPLVIPGAHGRKRLGRLNQLLLEWSLQRHVKSKDFSMPLIWTYHPFMLDAIAKLKHGSLLYHCVDDLAAVPGVDAHSFLQAEAALCNSADVVFATTKTLQDRCSKLNTNTHYLSNVVDFNHFGRALENGDLPPEVESIPKPRLVYHGVLSDFKIDFSLLYDCARLKPDWHWVLIGDQREGQESLLLERLVSLANVHLLGYRRYTCLPDYLRGMQVGLLPTLVNKYTQSMFPMKFYEYLAAGLPVVSTPLDFAGVSLSTRLEIGGNPLEFVQAIQSQLEQGRLNPIDARAAVGANTWSDRMDAMMKLLPDKALW